MDIQQLTACMMQHDYSYNRKELTQTAQYLLQCVSEGNDVAVRVELMNNGDKVSPETKELLRAHLLTHAPRLSSSKAVETATELSRTEVAAGQLGTLVLQVWKVSPKVHKNRFYLTVNGEFIHEYSDPTQYFINHPEYGVNDVMERSYLFTRLGINEKIPGIIQTAASLESNWQRLQIHKKGCNYDRVAYNLKWFKECYNITIK